jgi:hypothetical protein
MLVETPFLRALGTRIVTRLPPIFRRDAFACLRLALSLALDFDFFVAV